MAFTVNINNDIPICFLWESFQTVEEISSTIVVTHTEFILIHPFHGGNGRLGGLLSMLMGLQAGLQLLNFDELRGKKRLEYFAVVQAGSENDYSAMKKIFYEVIDKTLKAHG